MDQCMKGRLYTIIENISDHTQFATFILQNISEGSLRIENAVYILYKELLCDL